MGAASVKTELLLSRSLLNMFNTIVTMQKTYAISML
jgi:hypothetical protein